MSPLQVPNFTQIVSHLHMDWVEIEMEEKILQAKC